MKIGERGQVTVPKRIRDRFGLRPATEVEFQVVKGAIVLNKRPRQLRLAKWKGRCGKSLKELGYRSGDDFIEGVRGR